MFIKYKIAVIVLTLAVWSSNAQQVKIQPELPQQGQKVTITYYPSAEEKAGINAKDTGVTLVFTYSNFFDLPTRLPMVKKDNHWETSFQLARYAIFATFVLESGDKKQKPAPDKHYSLIIYNKNKRVESSYLYESYSIATQMGKDKRVPGLQDSLLKKELELFPDNYQAKVQLLNNKMKQATGSDKEKYRQQALDVIAANFYKQPGNPGLMNKTTMGYLMIGEKTRLDSIRNVIKVNYPESEAGYDLRISDIIQIKDREQRKKSAEAMLEKAKDVPVSYVKELHELLLEYYAENKNEKLALYHLNQLPRDTTPYRGEVLLERAHLLLKNQLLLDTALAYTERALAIAPTFPVGLIRYFPETGHILPYVDPGTRTNTTLAAKGKSLSLMALILLKQNNPSLANQKLSEALNYSNDATTLENAGVFYRQTGDYAKAYEVTRKRAIEKQEDSTAVIQMKDDYQKWKKSSKGWEQEMQQVENHWQQGIITVLKKERINKKAPMIANLVTLEGKPITPEDMAGKIVVIDFWATWCLPCMKEMPYLQKVYDKFKNNPKVMFMVLNSGSGNTLEDARSWSGNKTYSFPVYYTNDKALSEKFEFNVIPATFVIAPSGNIQFKTIGFEGPSIEYKLAGAIELLLDEAE